MVRIWVGRAGGVDRVVADLRCGSGEGGEQRGEQVDGWMMTQDGRGSSDHTCRADRGQVEDV